MATFDKFPALLGTRDNNRPFSPGEWQNQIDAVSATPKPATTEPPEWKGEPCARPVICRDDAGRRYCALCWEGDPGHPVGGFKPQPSPLDRALEDFIERRKAKREASGEIVLAEGWGRALRRASRLVAKGVPVLECEPIVRAFQQPVSFTARLGMKT